ncbi:DUF817 family protein [Acinetobacter soli]|nr:DUF817 family protein [Acinetobacter soli]WEI01831.1 DUF817 family protein [Acinetobacter soli]
MCAHCAHGQSGVLRFFRYDYLLFYAVIIQVCLIYLKLESWAEVRVIALFHLMAMVMEIFLTHPAIASWQYPQPAVFRLWTVPLFAGFMYSAVGSFLHVRCACTRYLSQGCLHLA